MLKKTPLHPEHVKAGAKLVDFGGWEMPLHYGSQVEEHHIVRRGCGLFDVSHMRVVDLEGAPRPFLRGLLANNVEKLKTPGKALYSCMLNPEGGVIDDLIVYFVSESHFRLVVNAATADGDLAWMAQHCPADVRITPRADLAIIAVQGPLATQKLAQACPKLADALALKPFNAATLAERFIARTGYTGEDGFEIMLPASDAASTWQALLSAGAEPCGLGARDTLRLEAGMNLYGQDMDTSISPLECGLKWTVDLASPRDFIGKNALVSRAPRHDFVGLVLETRGVLRAHLPVQAPGGSGETTSGSFSPTLQCAIALARVPVGTANGSQVTVDIRGKLLPARVVKPVFVRNGQSQLDQPIS